MNSKLFIVFTLISTFCTSLIAQIDTNVHTFKEVQVTGFKEEKRTTTSVNIASLSAQEMRNSGTFNISDGLSKMAGISQLTTGVAISKPVIRGLYGNRILTLLSGLRFDNQQWQDEHGLGLSDVGIDRVEVIKGPLAILYGTDAVGGVLNVIEENKAPENKIAFDYNLRFNTNTLGGITDIGVKGNRNNKWWRIRAGAESNADYTDGNNNRILNSRFNGYYFKGSFGTQKKNWMSENNYNFSFNNFGFIMNDIYDFLKPDARYRHTLDGPHHSVILNILSSQNTCVLKKGVLKLNLGFQSNSRREDEGGGQVSLNMLLSTGQYNLQYITALSEKVELIVSHASSFENNTNFGGRVIIPDANLFETSLSALFKFHWEHVIVEAAAGINNKWIKTLLTRSVNTPDKLISPFSQNRLAGNGMLGITFNPDNHWNVKLNAASGLRAPNLAELASNGLHEGIFTYEIGDPKMKNERNINIDASISYESKYVRFAGAAFYNQFFNYIYLAPTTETFFGFPVYRFKQQNAHLTGAEVEFDITPQGKCKGLEWKEVFSTLVGKTGDGNYLPFIAPPKILSSLKYQNDINQKIKNMFGCIGLDYVFEQNKFAPLESKTKSYYLLNASFGFDVAVKRGSVNISVMGNNLLGAQYYDHLSRFKNYGIHNIGRNIQLMLRVPLLFNYSHSRIKS